MGGICSSCASAQVPQSMEENIFEILPRDAHAPDDLFKPPTLDVHFARNNSIASLMAKYPSRRLPDTVVSTIWKHYFSSFLARGPNSPTPSRPVPGPDEVSPIALALGASCTRSEGIEPPSQVPSQLPSADDADPNSAEITCMQWLVTDILRHDLACLKERYDEVLAASLSLPAYGSSSSSGDGFTFNPEPVLKAIRADLQRLNNMPSDYLARTLLKEMKGIGEEEELENHTPRHTPRPQTRPPSGSMPPPQLNAVVPFDSPGPVSPSASNPLDKLVTVPMPMSPGGPSSATTLSSTLSPRGSELPALHSARGNGSGLPLPALTLARFAAHVDLSMKNLFDRYYRKGYWVLFSLNVMHHAKKIAAKGGLQQDVVLLPHPPLSARSGQNPLSRGTWSDRISHALAASEQQPITLRKTSSSAGGGAPPAHMPPTNRSPVAIHTRTLAPPGSPSSPPGHLSRTLPHGPSASSSSILSASSKDGVLVASFHSSTSGERRTRLPDPLRASHSRNYSASLEPIREPGQRERERELLPPSGAPSPTGGGGGMGSSHFGGGLSVALPPLTSAHDRDRAQFKLPPLAPTSPPVPATPISPRSGSGISSPGSGPAPTSPVHLPSPPGGAPMATNASSPRNSMAKSLNLHPPRPASVLAQIPEVAGAR